MTSVGVTKHTPGHDRKRRGERLVRASGLPYTIVQPGWFDYKAPDQLHLVMTQGDRKWAATPPTVRCPAARSPRCSSPALTSPAAVRQTFELAAEPGPAQADLEPLFAALQPDAAGSVDAVLDVDNMPLDGEPASVCQQLLDVRDRWGK